MPRFVSTSIYEIEHDCSSSDKYRLITKLKNTSTTDEDTEFKALQDEAFETKKKLNRELQKGLSDFRGDLSTRSLQSMLDSDELTVYFEQQLNNIDNDLIGFEEVIAASLLLAAMKAKPLVKRSIERASGIPQPFTFDPNDPKIRDYIKNYTGQKITYIKESARGGVTQIMLNAADKGYSNARVASEIKKTVGLHPRQIKAIQNREAQLIKSGLSGKQLEKSLADYTKKQHDYRARMIASTEASFINNDALAIVVEQDTNFRNVNGMVAAKQWYTADWDRVCAICRPLDSKIILYDDTFLPNLPRPPAHPHCQCGWNLVYITPIEARNLAGIN